MFLLVFVFLLFVVLLIVGRAELGIKGIAICIALFIGLNIAVEAFGVHPMLVAGGLALLDIGMILFVFGGDLTIH